MNIRWDTPTAIAIERGILLEGETTQVLWILRLSLTIRTMVKIAAKKLATVSEMTATEVALNRSAIALTYSGLTVLFVE